MPAKTVKTTKRPTAAKKTTVKKTTAKKPTVKVTPAAAQTCVCGEKCACGATCKCGTNCACGAKCVCGDKCACHRGGCKFCRVVKKLIVFLVIFALGFAAAQLCCCGKKGPKFMQRGPRVHFVNGCVDMAAVKCPKLAESLANMDINGDGCITREEYRAVKKKMRREIREMPVQEEVTETVAE